MVIDNWVFDGSDAEQVKRLEKARNADCTPVSINREDRSASFSGRHGEYVATLNSCTCVDFLRRRAPCKHILRLAIEFGVISVCAASDTAQIKQPSSRALPLPDAVGLIEALPSDVQKYIYKILGLVYFGKGGEIVGVLKCPELTAALDAGVFVVCDDTKAQVRAYSRNELRDVLLSFGVPKFNKNMRLELLQAWVLENVQDLRTVLSDSLAVKVSEPFSRAARKLYTYLSRVFDAQSWEYNTSDDVLCLLKKYGHDEPPDWLDCW